MNYRHRNRHANVYKSNQASNSCNTKSWSTSYWRRIGINILVEEKE